MLLGLLAGCASPIEAIETEEQVIVVAPGADAGLPDASVSAPDTDPAPHSIHAVGHRQVGANPAESIAVYLRAPIAEPLEFERIDLPGTSEGSPRFLGLGDDAAYIQSSRGNLWIVEGSDVRLLDLATEVGASLKPLGILNDGERIRVLAQAIGEPGAIHVWTLVAGVSTHSTAPFEPDAYPGPSALQASELTIGGTRPVTGGGQTTYWRLQANGWSAQPMSDGTSHPIVYGMTARAGEAHLVGETDDHAIYWRHEESNAPVTTALPEDSSNPNLVGSLATSVAIAGDEVYVGGVLLLCRERDVSLPVYWRIADHGRGDATLVQLPISGSPHDEPWVIGSRAGGGRLFIGGYDGGRATLWVVPIDSPEEVRTVTLEGISIADLQLGN